MKNFLVVFLFLLLVPDVVFAAPALVQKAKVYTGTTAALAFPSANTAGNLIVVMVGDGIAGGTPTGVPTITDSKGNIYTLAANKGQGNSNVRIFYAKNIAGGANTVTGTKGSPSQDFGFQIAEFSGIDKLNPFVASSTNGNAGSANPSTSNLTSTRGGLIVAGLSGESAECPSITAGAGFTMVNTQSTHCDAFEYRAVSVSAYTPAFINASTEWAMASVLFKDSLNTATLGASPVNSLTKGLVGYWTFNGKDTSWRTNTTNDMSGQGKTGTLTNMSTTSSPRIGKIGQGFYFDGVDDLVNLGDNFDFTDSSSTVCAWTKPNNSASQGYIYGKWGTAGYFVRKINNTSPDSLDWLMGTGGTGALQLLMTGGVDINKWQHLCAVFVPSPGTSVFYKNGISRGTSTSMTNPADNATSATIGNRADVNQRQFGGLIDDVRIYNRALSASEVLRLYNISSATIGASPVQSLTQGLVGYWTFDGKDMPAGLVKDISGNGNHGSMISMATSTAYTMGKSGQGLKFDGTSNYITGPTYNGVKTVSFWLKPNSTTQQILNLDANLASTSISSGTVLANNFTSPTIYVDGVNTSTITTGWHFVAITTATDINASAIQLGKTGTGFYAGTLDDVRIYNRALSAGEILRLYNQTK